MRKKWRVRADCRPPSRLTVAGSAESKEGDKCEACPDDEWKEDEDNDEIGGALDDVVGVAFSGIRRRATQRFREHFAECVPFSVGGCGEQVFAEVAGQEAGDHVDQAGDYQDPCGLEVEIAAPAILVGPGVVVAGGNGVARCRDGNLEEWSGARVAGFAPVETRVRDDDLHAGDEQGQERNDRDPVGYADERRVPLRGLHLGRGSDGHAGRIAHGGCDSVGLFQGSAGVGVDVSALGKDPMPQGVPVEAD